MLLLAREARGRAGRTPNFSEACPAARARAAGQLRVPTIVAATGLAIGTHLGCSRGLVLLSLDVDRHRAEVLVIGDCDVGDTLLMRVEDGAGQDDALVPDLDAAIGKLVSIGAFAHQFAGQLVHLQPDALVGISQRQILADIVLVVQTDDLDQSLRRDL